MDVKTPRACSFEGCGRPHKGKGLCNGHYAQANRGKELRPLLPGRTRRISFEEHFWSKVKITGACWPWTAAVGGKGYGQIVRDDRTQYAHRVAYELTRGDIPEGLQIDHICRNRRCVNPAHLRLATSAQNAQNLGLSPRSTSGCRGVSWSSRFGRWEAYAKRNGKKRWLGYFDNREEADRAARAFRLANFTHNAIDRELQR